MAENLTIFQRLGRIIGPDAIKSAPKQTQQSPRYNINGDVLLKTDNKADYERAKYPYRDS